MCDDIVLPQGALICRNCLQKLVPLTEPVCKKCGRQLFSDRQEYCEECAKRPRSFDVGRALLLYNETAMTSMAAVKYRNKREYLDFYAAACVRRFASFVREEAPSVLVPVPIHPARRRIRGYNQAEELAARLSKGFRIPLDTGLLTRVKNTDPLKELSASERAEQLRKAFAVSPDRSGKEVPERVLLIDDIYTTGSTVEVCAEALKEGGVKRVSFLTLCMGYTR